MANELGIPYTDIAVEHGDTDHTPYGLGTYASRSTPTGGAATALVARKLREKARQIAAHLLECSADDLEFDIKKPLPKLGNFFQGGFNVLYADGSVRFFPKQPKFAKEMITRGGGEVTTDE